MRRAVLLAALLHVIGLSFVWIGFAAPAPKQKMEFLYNGSSVPVNELSQPGIPLVWKTNEGGDFRPWIEMRGLNKPAR